MSHENDIKELQRQLAKTKASVRRTEIKVEELEVLVDETYPSSERIILFPRHGTAKPVRVDKSENIEDFFLT
jgi:hypothetical protein